MGELLGHQLTKIFPDGTRAVDRVSFRVSAGRVLTLLGPSGCGKSTLLRIVAGLETASAGTLELDGRRLDGLPTGRREVGFVFQNYALYPHLDVAGNLSLPLEARKMPAAERARRVRETAELLGIGELLRRRPAQLSGGQQQRVALGRALVKQPRLLLLDEPLSNLDALLREGMRAELKSLFHRMGATVLYVTHDQAEAMSLSDDVAVMRAGRVLQCAPPLDLYARPADRFVATFVGSPRMTAWPGRCEEGLFRAGDVAVEAPRSVPRGEAHLGVRPEDVEVSGEPRPGARPAELSLVETLGAQVLLTLRTEGQELRALAEPRDWPSRLWVRLPPERLHWFDASGRRVETATGEEPAR